MADFAKTLDVPFTITEYGTIPISDSRVSLDSVLHYFKLGVSAEQIALSFPSLKLADIYAAIAYYLNHRDGIEEYLRHQEAEADELQRQRESDPERQAAVAELRERLHARWAELHGRKRPAT
jgi:uncharacterized protein (DUF433 family)